MAYHRRDAWALANNSPSEVVWQIVDRQVEKKEAKARGLKPGRRPKLAEHQQREAIKRRDQGVETLAEIGRSYNVSVATISGSRRD